MLSLIRVMQFDIMTASEVKGKMRRTKEDMLVTKQAILDAGFDCFYEKGYEATSLTEIADRAGVTRGAIYWHFESKMGLYEAVVDYTLENGDVAKYFDELAPNLTLEERMIGVFTRSLGENRYVDFVFKTIIFTLGRPEFTNIYNKLISAKKMLLKAFQLEVSIYARMNGISQQVGESVAKELYLLFEGMFLTKNVPIGMDLDEESIRGFVHMSLLELEGAATGSTESLKIL